MRARDEFYRVMADDLTNYGRESVLYQYLAEEQEKKAAGDGKKDRGESRGYQLWIRYYRRQLKAGEISPEDYLRLLLEVLLKKTQFARICGKLGEKYDGKRVVGYTSEDPEPLLQGMLEIVLGKRESAKKGDYMRDIRRAYDMLVGEESARINMLERLNREGFFEPPYGKLMKMTDAVLDVAVAYNIKEFFFDTAVEKQADYAVVKRPGASEAKEGGSRAERVDKSLKLIESYCEKRGKSLFGTGDRKDPGDIECEKLYRGLLEEGNEEVFVPLTIDRATGCGIYLIGKTYFEGSDTEESEDCCAYGVLYFDDDYGEGIKTGYHISNRFGEFQNYNEARFDGDWSYEKMRQDAEAAFQELNGAMPDGVPQIFRRYFEGEREETEALREEVREQTERQERELREKN